MTITKPEQYDAVHSVATILEKLHIGKNSEDTIGAAFDRFQEEHADQWETCDYCENVGAMNCECDDEEDYICYDCHDDGCPECEGE